MNALVSHLEKINAKTQKWMDENPGSWGGMVVTDPAHWAEYGVHTVEDYERYQLETYIYEAHKDAFGVKGRHYDFKSMSLAQLEAEADYISNAVKEQMDAEAEAEKASVSDFEKRVSKTIESGAGNRTTALRWIMQSENMEDEYDAGYICYCLNLPYSYEKEFQPLIKEVA